MSVLANNISILKVSNLARLSFSDLKLQKKTLKLLRILYDLGFIRGFTVFASAKKVRVFHVYSANKPVLRNIVLISRGSTRVYAGYKKILKDRRFRGYERSLSFFIISSSSEPQAFLTDLEAIMIKSGGELVAMVS